MAEWTFGLLIVSIIALVLTVLGVIFVWKTLKTAKRDVTLAHPPRFKITHPILHERVVDYSELPDFTPGAQIFCRCFLVNYGRYNATIGFNDAADEYENED